MKKIYLLAVLILAVSVAGCTKKQAAAEPAGMTEAAASISSEPESVSETRKDSSEEEKTVDFAKKIVEAVKNKDMDALILLSGFPVYISSVEENEGVVESIEEFGEVEPQKLFTDEFVKAVTSFDLSKLEKSEAGYVLGDGKPNVIFTAVKGEFKITGINVR